MSNILSFIINSILLGVGLAIDAFSVSLANGLNDNKMKITRTLLIAGIFALFQFAMPMAGWFCVNKIMELFIKFKKFIPYIALVLLLYIGGKMLIEGIKGDVESEAALSISALLVQGVATSIDALSVGFTIAEYQLNMAFFSSLIIGVVTFFICLAGLFLGKKFGMKLADKASILGGVILILIGLEIFISHLI